VKSCAGVERERASEREREKVGGWKRERKSERARERARRVEWKRERESEGEREGGWESERARKRARVGERERARASEREREDSRCACWHAARKRAQCGPVLTQGAPLCREREFFIDNPLVRSHFIIAIIRWTGLEPWEFELPFPGSLISTCLVCVDTMGPFPLHKGPPSAPPLTPAPPPAIHMTYIF
jgi:hypothetical protein